MKNIAPALPILLSIFYLTACMSEPKKEVQINNDEYSVPENSYSNEAPTTIINTPAISTPSPQITITPPAPIQPSTSTPEEEIATPTSEPSNVSWYRVYMHYGLLKGQYKKWKETGGYLPLNLAENAYKGSYSIALESSHSLLPEQLLTYRGSNNEYYTVAIQSISGNTINLATPLEKDVWYGESLWNFYDNSSHPNYRGHQAISDYAVRSLGQGNLNYGTHVLFGDSWFSSGIIRDRLKESLSNATIINLGIGGQTSNDLVARFDSDVPTHNPNFVWVLVGTNDYWNYIPATQYKQNIKQLISKIEALGARAIIIDPSVAPLNYGRTDLTELSHAYSDAIDQLQN